MRDPFSDINHRAADWYLAYQMRSLLIFFVLLVIIGTGLYLHAYLARRQPPQWQTVNILNNSIVSVGDHALPAPIHIDPSLNILGNKALLLPNKFDQWIPISSDRIFTFDLRFPEEQQSFVEQTLLRSQPIPSDSIDPSISFTGAGRKDDMLSCIYYLKGGRQFLISTGWETFDSSGGTRPFAKDYVSPEFYRKAFQTSDSPVRSMNSDCVVRITFIDHNYHR